MKAEVKQVIKVRFGEENRRRIELDSGELYINTGTSGVFFQESEIDDLIAALTAIKTELNKQ